jgi:hypothetical protein
VNVTIMVMTDGRKECLVRTIEGMREHLISPLVTEVLIIDDSADPKYGYWLEEQFHGSCTVVHNDKRLGFGGAIQSGWDNLTDCDWVFHLEDDFVMQRPVPLLDMIATLVGQPHLVQLALRRQPVNDIERMAGGVVEQWPAEYLERNSPRGAWLEHRLFWTTNPSLYRHSLTRLGWPQVERSERAFGQRLLREGTSSTSAEDVRFAFWGRRTDVPWVEHIGAQRIGTGY